MASHVHVSGPLAMVIVGLAVGNHGRELAMSDTTRRYLDMFWELVDEILNAVLFVLIGMEVILISLSWDLLLAALLAIIVTVLARLLTVGAPVGLLPRVFNLPAGSWPVLTYGVVLFSILVQGLTIGRLARRSIGRSQGTKDQIPQEIPQNPQPNRPGNLRRLGPQRGTES